MHKEKYIKQRFSKTSKKWSFQVSFEYFDIDGTPATHTKTFNEKEQRHLIASFNIPEQLTKQQVKQLKKSYQQLKSLSIQNNGINNYSFNQAKVIHESFYPELSLNSEPLSYRDPFTQKVLEKK